MAPPTRRTNNKITSGKSSPGTSAQHKVPIEADLPTDIDPSFALVIGEIRKSQQFLSLKYDNSISELKQINNVLTQIQEENKFLRNENEFLKEKISHIENDFALLKQDAVSNNIVIGNFPVLENEIPALLQKHVFEAIKRCIYIKKYYRCL